MIDNAERWIYESEHNKKTYKKKISHLSQSLLIYLFCLEILISIVIVAAVFFHFDEVFELLGQGADAWYITGYIWYRLISNEVILYTMQIASSIFAAFAAVSYYKLKQKHVYLKPFREKTSRARYSKYFVFITIGATVAADYIITYTAALLERLGLISPPDPKDLLFAFPDTIPGIVLYFIAVVIVAPVVEEYFYRGILFKELSHYGTRFAVIFSSLIFGIMHRSVPVFIFAAVFGIFACVLYVKTNSLVYPMIAHAVINFSSFIQNLIISNYDEIVFLIFYFIFSAVLFSIALVFTIFLAVKKRDFRISADDRYHIKKTTKVRSLFNFALLIFFFIMLAVPVISYMFNI